MFQCLDCRGGGWWWSWYLINNFALRREGQDKWKIIYCVVDLRWLPPSALNKYKWEMIFIPLTLVKLRAYLRGDQILEMQTDWQNWTETRFCPFNKNVLLLIRFIVSNKTIRADQLRWWWVGPGYTLQNVTSNSGQNLISDCNLRSIGIQVIISYICLDDYYVSLVFGGH